MSDRRSDIELAAAARIVADDTANLSEVRWASRACFEANLFDCAQRGFARVVAADRFDDNDVAALQQIYADRGDNESIVALINRYLSHPGADLTPERRFAWLVSLFDAVVANAPESERADASIQLLEAAASAGDRAWAVVLEPKCRAVIEDAIREPSTALAAFEQFAYAPAETGLPAEAHVRLEDLGCRHAADRDVSRAAEQLLHALGQPAAAYRVEACRRAIERATASATPAVSPAPRSQRFGLVITVAGGHAALRSLARRDLVSLGVAEMREVPSAWEATRDTRSVHAMIAGSDLVVVIPRQIAHSTSDQVRKTADRFGVTVAQAETASVAAIYRAVERFVVEQSP